MPIHQTLTLPLLTISIIIVSAQTLTLLTATQYVQQYASFTVNIHNNLFPPNQTLTLNIKEVDASSYNASRNYSLSLVYSRSVGFQTSDTSISVWNF